jgi:nucleoside-diphosphate-sugar epimerase
MTRKVIVFGATGEIGGRIARGCVRAGHSVTGVSRGKNTRETVDLSGVKMIYGDKADESFIRDTVAKLDYDAVIDSVANIANVETYSKHLKKAENILICSSTGTFVPLRWMPADETHPWREKTAVNFYPQSVRDARALELWEAQKFPVTVFRPTNIIGEGRVPLELWGSRDIEFFKKLKNGEPVHIPSCEKILVQSGFNDDLADAFVKSLDFPDRIRGEIFIISCKKAITLGSYLKTAMDFLGSKSEIISVTPEELMKIYPSVTWTNRLDFLLEHMCFDIGKAERTFGYAPEKTAEQGLAAALEWCDKTGLL